MAQFRPNPQPEIVTVEEDGSKKEIHTDEVLNDAWNIADCLLLERGEKQALRRMQAVYLFTLADRSLPSDLKKWFLDSIDAHVENDGQEKFDAIFGYTGKESQRNAYTEARLYKSTIYPRITSLLSIAKMPVLMASRLAIWRDKTDADAKNIARYYREHIRENPPAPKRVFSDFGHREMDSMVLMDYINAASWLNTDGVEKDLERLKKAVHVIENLSEEEYFELISKKELAEFLKI